MSSHEPLQFLSGGGDCGTLARSIDWASTSLGAPETWPTSLKTVVGIMLHSRHPMFLWWGEELVQFYNDGYRPSFGSGKHPTAMGQRGVDCWQEIWPIISPQIDGVMRRGEATWNDDQLVPIFRNGRIEEVYWTYGYSPVYREDGEVGGTLVVCTETTARVLAERRLASLYALSTGCAGAKTHHDVADALMSTLTNAARDVPFAIVHRGDATTVIGIDAGRAAEILAAHPPSATPQALAVEPVTTESWPEPVASVFVKAIEGAKGGSIVFGLSPRLGFDEDYRTFLNQLVQSWSSASGRVGMEAERRNLLEQAPVATALMIGADYVFELANPLYCEMVGRDVRGKPYLEAFPELRATPLPGILARVYECGEPFVTNEMVVPLDRAGNGELVDCFFKFNLEPLRNAEGVVYGMMATAIEITEQVVARRALEAAARAKDEFLATMSHELRTPLNAMLGWARLLSAAPRRDVAKLEKGLAVIERNAMAQARIIDDLLDVSRIISGKLRLALRTVDVTAALHAAADGVRPAAQAKKVELVLKVDREVGTMVVDPDRFQQILWNVLTNAIRFTPAGGTVKVSAERSVDGTQISVEDTGAGIAAQHLPHIFDRFHQVDASLTRAHGGLGLGLSIVRYLAEAHGGRVTASSGGLGFGTRFVVTIPLRTLDPSSVDEEASGPSSRDRRTVGRVALGGVRVLVVEDDDDSRALVVALLESVGAVVVSAATAVEALALNDTFDLVISDIGMPDVDGYTFIRRLRARDPDVPAIALTAFARREDAAHALDSGYQEHITKPVDASRLLATVHRLTQR